MSLVAPLRVPTGMQTLPTLSLGPLRSRTSLTERDLVFVGRNLQEDARASIRQAALEQAALQWASDLIEPLRDLPYGWDSFDGQPLDRAVAFRGTRFLAGLALAGIASPQVFPSRDGGLSMEWHRPDLDFVISFYSEDEPASAFFRHGGQSWEVDDIFSVPDPRLGEAWSAVAAER